MTRQVYDKEKEQFNLARLKSHGHKFEVVVDPKAAVEFKKGKAEIRDVLQAENVFHDAKRGELASEDAMKKVFGTTDVNKAAAEIIKKGQIQLTEDQRSKDREKKLKQIIELIHRNAVDPNGTPHPRQRIENALEEANAKIDYNKTAQDQLKDVVSQINHIIPIKFEVKEVQINLSAEYATKVYGTIKQYGNLLKEDWHNDGSWTGILEIPGGIEIELYDALNNATHGEVQTQVIKSKGF